MSDIPADVRENPRKGDVIKVGRTYHAVLLVHKRLDGAPWMVECRTTNSHGDVFTNFFQMRHWRARCDKATVWSREESA